MARSDDAAQAREKALTVDVGKLMGQALEEKRTKPRVGMTVIYFIDGPTNGRTRAAKVTRVIDRDRVELQWQTRRGHRYDSEPVTATYAPASRAPRPAGSWDFIV